MLTAAHWREQCANLSVAEPSSRAPWKPLTVLQDPGANVWSRECKRLEYDGHFAFPRILPEAWTQSLLVGVEQLRARGLPAVFLMIYDEFWLTVSALRPAAEKLLGGACELSPDFWVWRIDPQQNQAGWKPHRDAAVNEPDPNYPARSITLWTALSDATPENGCIYLLPKSKDAGYPHTLKFDVSTLQHVKAMPAPAGSVIGWNQSVFHWGASTSREAVAPRVSFAVEVRRVTSDGPSLLPFDGLPSFNQRLSLLALQFENYKHLFNFREHAICDAFVTEVTAGRFRG